MRFIIVYTVQRYFHCTALSNSKVVPEYLCHRTQTSLCTLARHRTPLCLSKKFKAIKKKNWQ